MEHHKKFWLTLACAFLLSISAVWAQTGTIRGTITDETGSALPGANVAIAGTNLGAATGNDGSYQVSNVPPGSYTLNISFIGYESQTAQVVVASGETATVNISLQPNAIQAAEIVISASRKPEKVQEAPSAVSVLGARELATSPQLDPMRNLINVPGVQIQQQSAARMNIALRGQALLFNTSVFPIMDYRSLVSPGTGTFQSDAAGISTIDLQRIEVVRGPGSALYGPGVTSGVIHFITKNPIDFPGTTVEITPGELNTIGVTVRHAGRSNDRRFGYKINAHYRRGDEFTLDLVDDADQIAKFKTTVSQPAVVDGIVDVTQPAEVLLTEEDLDSDGDGNPLQDDWWNGTVNATLEFRPQDDLSIFVSGGMNQASALFYQSQGEGLFQAREFWTQARVQKGGLFGQFFYVDNDGGTKDRPSFLYQTGLRTPIGRKQIEGQLQYNFGVPALLDADFTAGFDVRSTLNDTEHLVYGRNEDDDDYNIYGGYLQGKFKLANELDLFLSGRYDEFNFLDDGFFAPRAALVFKASPTHTFRASYNRASSPPTSVNMHLDFPVASPVPGLFDAWAVGLSQAHTWNNPVLDITVPGVPDLPVDTPGLPLAIPYGMVNQGVLDQLVPALEANPALAPLVPGIVDYLTNNPPAGVTGSFFRFNLFDQTPMNELTTNPSAQLSKTNAFEFGYKGLIAEKLSISVDVYRNETEGFIVFDAVGPTVALINPDIAGDLSAAVESGLTDYLINTAGLDAATAGAVAAQVGAGYAQAGQAADAQLSPLYSIFGVIESDQMPKDDGIAHVPLGYRSFGDASTDYWGADIQLHYYANDNLSFFGNYSWISKNRWGPGAEDEGGLAFPFSLNTPKNKFRIGVLYLPSQGVFGSLAFQHDDSFFGNFGQFRGDTDEVNVVDASVGYKFRNGVQLGVSATNLFDADYKAFNNFPRVRRRVVAKLTYNFGAK